MARIAIIPARGNSKGIPRKNLHPVAGRPLLAYTVDAALASGQFDEVIVSSECDHVLAQAVALGATPSRRPDHLSDDDVHSVRVVLDILAARGLPRDTLVTMLLPTSPLRTAEDIAKAMRSFEAGRSIADEAVDSLVSVYRDGKHLMQFRRIGADGLLEPLLGGDPNVQRQDVAEHYVVNGSIYVSTAGTLLDRGTFHGGRVLPFLMDRSHSVDVNTAEDLQDVERMLSA